VEVRRLDEFAWEVPRRGGMRVPGRVYASEAQMGLLRNDPCLEQVANVAHLPGIVGASLAMPDIHWGYGFPIGGVAAMDVDEGVVSPGGVGYDINCGVRLVRTSLRAADLGRRLDDVVRAVFSRIPTGVGASGAVAKLGAREVRQVLRRGAGWAIDEGYGDPADLERTEEAGCLDGADPERVSDAAIERGAKQLGTLGSGNHFLEIGRVDDLRLPDAALRLGIEADAVVYIIHSGSRGLGYQVCDDHLALMDRAMARHRIQVPDRQLACAPIRSAEGEAYLGAMSAAANYAWANRQVMMSLAERAFLETLSLSPRELGCRLVYDVCHNVARIERHRVGGEPRKLCVHRKGATRAFGPGHPALPPSVRDLGQPVIVPGDMERGSFLALGTERAMEATFGSSCHGAGRVMSRAQSKKAGRGQNLVDEMRRRGVAVLAHGRATLAEEMPWAYRDVASVIDVMEGAGISRTVARIRPLGVIKG